MARDTGYRRIWALTIVVALLWVGGLACNDHALNPFGAVVRAGNVEKTTQQEVRTVDILFVVDNSNSMCEEQIGLQANFDSFIEILAEANADFRLAVVNSDMVTQDAFSTPGLFRQGPGRFVENLGTCTQAIPDLSFCDGLMLPQWLEATGRDLSDPTQVDQLKQEFACMALTGIDGEPVEMGLAAMQAALTMPSQADFFRPGSLLSVVFVTDENDCSDGTNGFDLGPVYQATQLPPPQGGDILCEYNRNVEDSCAYTADAPGGSVTIGGDTRSALAWCAQGDRATIEGNGEFNVNCPAGGCPNQLTQRSVFYNTLLQIVADKNGYGDDLEAAAQDIIIAAIINKDGNVRFNQDAPPTSPWCGAAGTQGYRYELFAQMFPVDRSVVSAICELDSGQPSNFADSLSVIAELIGKAINSLCLQAPPMSCDPDGLAGDGSCLPGKTCCPVGQTCNRGPFLAGTEFEYNVCSGFRVKVEVESTSVDGMVSRTELIQDTDFSVSLDATGCINSTGSPVEVSFINSPPAGSDLIISYPREVGEVFE